MWELALILIGAVALDWLLGDPPNYFHPVAWMGSAIRFLKAGGIARGKRYQQFYGFLFVAAGGCLTFILSTWMLNYLSGVSQAIYLMAGVLLLKSSFTFSGLKKAANGVAFCISKGNLEEARHLVAVRLVSRDTRNLDAHQVTSATVESVAENLTDSLVAPLFYFLVGGVSGALAYRFINTADAMLGYRDETYEYLGKGAALLDDVINYIPARLAGLLLVAASWLRGEDAAQAWKTMLREHSLTASPNAGWTMSAAAGALGVGLEKKGAYRLGGSKQLPNAEDIPRVVGLVKTAYILCIILVLVITLGA